jgi:hypothetical protein
MAALLSGCSGDAETDRSQKAQAPLSEAALANGVYLDQFGEGGTVRLTSGRYTNPDERLVMDLLDLRAYGDLDGDGIADAAVLLATNTGGSAVFVDLAAVVDRDGELRHIARYFLGDRVKPQRVTIDDGVIAVDLIVHGPDDPLCCPTRRVLWRLRLVDEALIRVD